MCPVELLLRTVSACKLGESAGCVPLYSAVLVFHSMFQTRCVFLTQKKRKRTDLEKVKRWSDSERDNGIRAALNQFFLSLFPSETVGWHYASGVQIPESKVRTCVWQF